MRLFLIDREPRLPGPACRGAPSREWCVKSNRDSLRPLSFPSYSGGAVGKGPAAACSFSSARRPSFFSQ